LAVLAALAAVSVLRSAAPAWLLLLIPIWLLNRWRLRGSGLKGELLLRSDGSAALISPAGAESLVESVAVQQRGPLTVLRLRTGRRSMWHVLMPDTLSRIDQRRLRLWCDREAAALTASGVLGRV
jgi:hypothetical protein